MDNLLKYSRIVFIGVGGGGDVVSAAMLAQAFKRLGIEAFVASIVWERFVIDPVPGPIGLDEIVNLEKIGRYTGLVNGNSYAIRGGKKVFFQAALVSKAISEKVIVIDLRGGVEGYIRALEELRKYTDAEALIGVDVGGDILAGGYEEELWSPLADSMGLAALNKVDQSYLVVHSPGSDGELPIDRVLERIAKVASMNGYLGARGITKEDVEVLKRILSYAKSEASLIQLYAFRGEYGEIPIRKGTRKIKVSPIHMISFLLDPRKVFNISTPAQIVAGTKSFDEAVKKLNEHGIYTEYNLEVDLLKANPKRYTAEIILKIRNTGRLNLRRHVMNDQSTDQ